MNDDHLPDHTVSMRSAFKYCVQLFSRLPSSMSLDHKEKIKAEQLHDKRQNAYDEFWNKKTPTMDSIYAYELSSPGEFRERFHNPNLPCLINGLEPHFESVQQWREDRVEWFSENLGEDTLVPLRYEHQSSSLDAEGRAVECKTRTIKLKEWIQMLQDDDGENYYLKDWHLILQLQKEKKESDVSLYECPEIFGFDLLNSFLTRFTNGDYRFCYWGPPQSSTPRHSDVLNSFSWSFNVVGTKQWTFFDKDKEFTVIQKAGQAIFVPCTWQHQVVNMEETISLNHNWITTANVDRVWDCLVGEMEAIHKELDGWDIADNLEACESMLRGCVGLDVTAFFFIMLTRLLELLAAPAQEENAPEQSFDIYRLAKILKLISQDDSIQLKQRMEMVLQSEDMALDLVSRAEQAIGLVNESL